MHPKEFSYNSFIHSDYFCSTSSSSLLLIGALDTARILCRNFMPKRHMQLAQGPYVAARAGVEPMTLWTKGVDSATGTEHHACQSTGPRTTTAACPSADETTRLRHSEVHSLPRKLEALKQLASDLDIPVLCLTETWLDDDSVDLR